jgi:fused signal recognition particle receptor
MPWSRELLLSSVALVLAGGGAILAWIVRRRRAPRTTPVAEAPMAPGQERQAPGGLQQTLARTRQSLRNRLREAWSLDQGVDERLSELEAALLAADVGPKATQALLERLRPRARELKDTEALQAALMDLMRGILADGWSALPMAKPYVIVVAGVNGVGKTTTIGKLAYRYRQADQKVLLVAADTFRAAAGEQLEQWAHKVGATCVRHQGGADPSAVAFDGMKAAAARHLDVVIVDTAGRLHVKSHLMEELKKVIRVIGRQAEGAPHEILLVIDATTGQNALNQARAFCDALPVSGIVLTKLDGTAKGGAMLAIRTELGLPIRYVGTGETPADLEPFDADAFVQALLAAD